MSPLYTIRCVDGHEDEILTTWENVECPCPICGQPTVRMWKGKAPTVIGDACHISKEHGFNRPGEFFTSKIERRRDLKAAGLEECGRHNPMPGTDKSKHSINHAQIMDDTTYRNGVALVSRPDALKGNDPAPAPLHITYVHGELPSGRR